MRYDFDLPPILTDEEVEEILGKADQLISWAEDIKEYALQSAIGGKQWQGYKLVEGRSNRKYADEAAVAKVVSEAGYDPYEQKLVGITEMTKRLGKKRFEELLSGLVIKTQGKPVLVPKDDDRKELNTAANDFEEEK